MKSIDRTGLYIMVAVTMFASCSANDSAERIERKINNWPSVVVTPVESRDPAEQYVGIVQTKIEIPDYCLNEYQYPRSDTQVRKCFVFLVEELRERANEQ